MYPSSFNEPAQGTTFIASGAGNGPKSEIAARTSPATSPKPLPATSFNCACKVSMPGCPAPDAAWYEETTSSFKPNSLFNAPIATIIESVVQFGLEIIPRGRFCASSGFTSGTTSGTSESIRNAPELSTTTAPRAAAIGPHSAEISSGTSNIAMSMPSNASGDNATTVNSSPRQINFLPAERADAIKRISP